MENADLLPKIDQLDKKIEELKSLIPPPAAERSRFGQILRFLVSNWILISVLVATASAVYVKFRYNIDPFEDVQNVATKKSLSVFYQNLGNGLMEEGNWDSANDAFKKALDLNPNNKEANYASFMVQAIQPTENQGFSSLNLDDSHMNQFLTEVPTDYHYLLFYLKGTQIEAQASYKPKNEAQADYQAAIDWYRRAVSANEKFQSGYISLGYVSQFTLTSSETLKQTIGYYDKAVQLNPDDWIAHSNLGEVYMLQGDFDNAIIHLERAFNLSPSLVTALDVGQVYRYQGYVEYALSVDQWSLKNMKQSTAQSDTSFAGEYQWLYNYMPTTQDDAETINSYVFVNTDTDKEIFLHYALSFDYALTGQIDQANQEFMQACRMDGNFQYSDFFANQIFSLQDFLANDLDDETVSWFDNHWSILIGESADTC